MNSYAVPKVSFYTKGCKRVENKGRQKGGRYGWVAAIKSRWKSFCLFCEDRSVLQLRQITPELVAVYASSLAEQSVSTAQNKISAVNAVMRLLTKNQWQKVSPCQLVKRKRSGIRRKPIGFDYQVVGHACKILESHGERRASLLLQLCFLLGLRRREALLLDVRLALKQARQFGYVDIIRGTKGGRSRTVERKVPAGAQVITLLGNALSTIGSDRCLVPADETYKQASNRLSYIALPVLKRLGVSRIHELRALYATNRYRQLTGADAPCQGQGLLASAESDEAARAIIVEELGHSRLDIASAYLGKKPRVSVAHG